MPKITATHRTCIDCNIIMEISKFRFHGLYHTRCHSCHTIFERTRRAKKNDIDNHDVVKYPDIINMSLPFIDDKIYKGKMGKPLKKLNVTNCFQKKIDISKLTAWHMQVEPGKCRICGEPRGRVYKHDICSKIRAEYFKEHPNETSQKNQRQNYPSYADGFTSTNVRHVL